MPAQLGELRLKFLAGVVEQVTREAYPRLSEADYVTLFSRRIVTQQFELAELRRERDELRRERDELAMRLQAHELPEKI